MATPDPKQEMYNWNELVHIAMNYAINCQKGYQGNFEDYMKNVTPEWRKIANRKR